MHPELLRALAKARHQDLLTEPRNRAHARVRFVDHSPRFSRSRQRVGSILVWTGSRLMGDQQTSLELTHE
jgi:hypothetical protein